MFVTMPQFHQPFLSAVALGGQQHWNAVVASFPVEPWYLFVYEAQFIDRRMNHTMLVAWEESLVQIIDSVPAADHRAVYRVDPGEGGALAFRALTAVWEPTAEEQGEGGGAIFRLEGEAEMLDPRLKPVSTKKRRRLVFNAPQHEPNQRSGAAAPNQAK